MLSALRRLETTDGRMNQSLSSSRNQQGDLNWVLESWDRSSSGAVGGGFLTRNHQGGELLDSSMLAAAAALPHNTAASWSAAASDGDGVEPKVYISPRQQQQCYNNNNSLAMQSSSPNLANNHHMLGGSCSVPLSLSALVTHHHHHHHHQQQQQHYHQNSSLQPFMNTPGVVPHVDFIRSSFEQHQQQQQQRMGMYGGIMDMGRQNQLSSIKREDVYGDGYGRIGLNLGVRTYFSTEDMLAARLLGKRPRAGSPVPMCQAQGCKADLRMAKHYHRRHKVCEMHSKASTVTANGQTQRFCQQCSRFHALTEFDEGKRSCRKRLADHNRRRRKPQTTNAAGAGAAAAASTTDEEHQSETSTKVNNDMENPKLELKNSSTSASENSDGSVKLQNSSSSEKIAEPRPPLFSKSELGTGTGTTTLLSQQQPQARNNRATEEEQQQQPNLSLGGSANQPHSDNPDDETWLRKRDLASITSNSSVEFNRTRSDQQQQAVHSQPPQSCSNWPVAETGPRFHWYS